MAFDEEELDPHGECAAEIARLQEVERNLIGQCATVRSALIDMLSLAKTISPYALSAAAQSRIKAAESALGHG